MRKDVLKDYTGTELKILYRVTELLKEWNYANELIISKDGTRNAELISKTITHTYTGGSYSYERDFVTITLPAEWYDDVYLLGLGQVRYNGKLSIALGAEPLDMKEVREDLQLPDMGIYKVTLPVWKEEKVLQNNRGHQWYNTKYLLKVEKRFMATISTDQETYCYAGLSPNRAAGTLKSQMLKRMKNLMGV